MGTKKSIQYSFKRYEKKYIVTSDIKDILLRTIKEKMLPDAYPYYTIYNIYFDTDDYELIRHSIERPVYKEKLRLRSYGKPENDSTVFLELKKKYDGIVYKRRISLPYHEAFDYLNSGIKPSAEGQIFNEIDYSMNFYKPKPKVFLSYDRTAFYGAEDNYMRITFDENIIARDYDLNLQAGSYGTRILEPGHFLMEIKLSGAMPLWLTHLLSKLETYPTSFSKYGSYYKMLCSDELPLEVIPSRA